MTELAVVHYRQFRRIYQVCRINYHGQSCQKQRTNPEEQHEVKRSHNCGLPYKQTENY